MSCRNRAAELLPFYAAGTLDGAERRAVADHLATCPTCRQELALWQDTCAAVGAENRSLPAPPAAVLTRALAAVRRARPGLLERARAMLAAQVPLVRREIWLTSAVVMAMGYLVAGVAVSGEKAGTVIEALAPLIASAGLAMIYGPESDPGLELALATPTSPRQVLLARLVLVFGYDLLLATVASVGLLAFMPAHLLGGVILGWLAPMTFLSALSLLLSLCIGTGNAVAIAFGLWLARGLAGNASLVDAIGPRLALGPAVRAYVQAWQSPALLLGLAAALVMAALWLSGRQEPLLRKVV